MTKCGQQLARMRKGVFAKGRCGTGVMPTLLVNDALDIRSNQK